jgi:hypothetical protein
MIIKDLQNILTVPEKDIIRQIPKIEQFEWMKDLKCGYSGAKVILAWVTYRNKIQALEVFKFGIANEIQSEKDNWEAHVKRFLDRANVVPVNHFVKDSHSKRGLIVYGCASYREADIQTFAEFWKYNLNTEKSIEYIFSHLLKPWYSRSIHGSEDLGLAVNSFFKKKLNRLKKAVNLPPHDCDRPGIEIKGFGRRLPNPLYKGHTNISPQNFIVPKSIIHGDLKAQNILLVNRKILIDNTIIVEKDICLIDYANTGQGNVLSDLADLEASIKFQLLELENIREEELFKFEEHICNDFKPTSTTDTIQSLQIASGELQKGLISISAIRREAARIIEIGRNIEPLSFFVPLYLHTLKSILHHDKTPLQKRYAFFSAAIILDKQLAKS